MKKAYRDMCNRIACYADGATGEIWHEYKRVETRTTIPVGGTYDIKREGIMTVLKRTEAPEFEVTSYRVPA